MTTYVGLQGLHIHILWLILVTMATVSSSTQYRYPSASLACKTYNKTKLDCSNRNLAAVPSLDQNSTTSLDLSFNQLPEITGAPFEQLQVLLRLDLSNNEISEISVTAFSGLYSLSYLDLGNNGKLTDLPKDVFTDLSNLIFLTVVNTNLQAVPSQAISNLKSLQKCKLTLAYPFTEIDFNGFRN